MANVDKELHNPEVTSRNLIKERTTSKAKRALRGAAGGIYVGPIHSVAAIGDAEDGSSYSSATTHGGVTGVAGGGTDNSTGYRAANAHFVDGDATGGGMGAGGTISSRPNPGAGPARSVYRGNGTFGGSVAGYPAQRAGQRASAASGSSLTADAGAAAFIDKRSDASDSRALGSSGRGSRVINGTVSHVAPLKGGNKHRFAVPVLSGADPAATGAVQLVDGTGGAVHADVHADDITGGANDWAGIVVYCFAKDTDTDEDAALVAKGDFDTVAEGAVTGLTGLTAAAYAFYVAFKDTEGNIGPWSNRFALTIT
jgi:hypothetical protein